MAAAPAVAARQSAPRCAWRASSLDLLAEAENKLLVSVDVYIVQVIFYLPAVVFALSRKPKNTRGVKYLRAEVYTPYTSISRRVPPMAYPPPPLHRTSLGVRRVFFCFFSTLPYMSINA